jgi:hypothetical protein
MKPEEYPQGAATLDATVRWLKRFVHLPSESHYTLTALWVAGSHMTDETGTVVHKAYGRLGFVSNVPASGKSTAMERALALTPRGEVLVQPSLAGIMDAIDERQIIALDEADKYFGKSGRMSHVVAFLNAGYKRGGGIVRHRARKVDSFSLVTYSGLLEALGVNPDLHPLRTRSFLVEMQPAPLGTQVEEYDDERHDGPESMLRMAIASWAQSVAHIVSDVAVNTPESVTNRRAQIWRPLLRTAALAGAEWPVRAWEACEELESGISLAPPVRTPEQRIMDDVLSVCEGASQLPTKVLLQRLHALPGSPWKFILPGDGTGTARELAAWLAPHGLYPDILWFSVPDVGRLQIRGYDLTAHQGCLLCPQTRSHTDEFASHTDESGSGTDEPASVTDDGNTPPPPVAAPRVDPRIMFSG